MELTASYFLSLFFVLFLDVSHFYWIETMQMPFFLPIILYRNYDNVLPFTVRNAPTFHISVLCTVTVKKIIKKNKNKFFFKDG